MTRDARASFGFGLNLPRVGVAALLAMGLAALTGCATMTAEQPVVPAPVTVTTIEQWSKQGVAPDEIIRRMRNSHTIYRLKASQLADLRDHGVANKVIDYMQGTYLAAVRRSAQLRQWRYWHEGPFGYWYGGEPFGWPYYWYWPDNDFFIAPFVDEGPTVEGDDEGGQEQDEGGGDSGSSQAPDQR